MSERISRLFFAPILALLLVLGISSQAFAAQTYQPAFNGSHVYLDPLLENGSPSVNLSGLEQQLKDAGKKHNIDFYFVMALKGSEPIQQGVPFAVSRLDDLTGKWTGAKNFTSSRYVIIYVVRLDTDWTKSSYAINPAPALAAEGVTLPNMVPLMDRWGKNVNNSNPSSLLPRAPRDFAVKIASEANNVIDAGIANAARQEELRKQEAERQRLAEIQRKKDEEAARIQRIADEKAAAERNAAIAQFLKIWTLPILLVIALIIMFVRFRNAKARAVAALATWRTKLDPANNNYLQLESEYLGFLKSLSANFVGETQRSLDLAKTAYGTLSARIKKAIAMAQDAEKNIGSANIFSVGKLNGVVEALTVRKVTVTGDDIPLSERSLFSGVVNESSFTPDELLADMEQLFKTANTNCADIMAAFKGADQNKADIEALVAKVEALKAELTERELTFSPYDIRFAAVSTGREEFLRLMASDPLTAYTKSETVERAVEAIETDIENAIKLKDSLKSTDKAIADAQARTDKVRAEGADYSYGDAQGTDSSGLPGKNLLNEKGGNPDQPLAQAREHLSTCLAHLLAGKLDAAQDEKAKAETKAAEAVKLIETVLAARAFVQKEVLVVLDKLSKLRGELPAADTALATLKAEFLTKNFEGQPVKVETAHKVADTTDGELAKVRKAFFEQRYLAARAELTESGGEIDSARNGLVEVHSRLKVVQDLRVHARETVKAAEQSANALSGKIKTNAFTTSAKTDEAYANALPVIREQKSDVAKDVTDWVEAAKAADRITETLKAVDKAIDDERKAYDVAKQRIADVVSAVRAAQPTFKQRFVRNTAESKYAEVVNKAGGLDGALKVAKSDWNALTRTVEGIKNALDEAVKVANADQRAGEQAEADIAAAGGEIRSVDNKSYSTRESHRGRSNSFGSSVNADVSSANSQLRRAQTEFGNGNYEAASRSAKQAEQAAREADRIALAAVAAAVAAWESQINREIAEEERREAEERRRRQQEEDDRRRRDEESRRSSSSSDSGFSGSGGSGGSGFSGSGGSGGGGDF